jgi:hypothetical protein
VAYAGAYTWDGDTSSDWQTATNWAEAGYPGKDAAGDTATINADTANDTVTVSGAVPNSVAWVLVDADAAGVDLELEIQSGGSLTTTGLVTLKGEQDGSSTATLDVQSGGSFAPDSMLFWGRVDSDTAHAIGDFDEDVTVTESCDGTVDTCMEGYVDIQLSNNVTVDFKDWDIGDCGSSGNEGNVDISGVGTARACSIVINGGDSAHTIVTASNDAMVQTY